jgi:hypothetical protein
MPHFAAAAPRRTTGRGERLCEDTLAQHRVVNHITLRDALDLLIDVDIAVRVPHKGVRAIVTWPSGLEHPYDIRSLPEVLASTWGSIATCGSILGFFPMASVMRWIGSATMPLSGKASACVKSNPLRKPVGACSIV